MGKEMLSPHFSREEMECRCCGALVMNQKLLDVLEEIRKIIGDRPVVVTSGYRCAKHNAEVGGIDASYHCAGMAADIYAEGVSLEEIAHAAKEAGAHGIGIYYSQGFVHVDVRNPAQAATWTTRREYVTE